MEQNKDSTILYGIRKIEHGAYDSGLENPLSRAIVMIFLSECNNSNADAIILLLLQYCIIGDDVSYAYIMAATGAAFRLVWNQDEWDLSNIDIYHNQNFLPSPPSSYSQDGTPHN